MAKTTKFVYRDSKTGQFVEEEYAKKHPKTTEKAKSPYKYWQEIKVVLHTTFLKFRQYESLYYR